MLRLLQHLVLLAREGAARVAALAELSLSAAERLAWDRERVAALRRGDEAAFSDLYHAYAGLLYARITLPLLKHPAMAEDALADTFVQAHAALREVVVTDRSIFFWLARVARNRALDVLRRRQTERRFAPQVERTLASLLPSEPDPESALTANTEEQLVASRIDAALQALHPRYARALRLRFIEERAREECASELGVTVPTFDVVLLRSLRAFRRAFEEMSVS